MANITNANSAYVSAENGNVYSLINKIYLDRPLNISNGQMEAYINYDNQGNFTIKGIFISNGNLTFTNTLNYPSGIFSNNGDVYSFNPQFIKKPQLVSLVDSNGNNFPNLVNQYNFFYDISFSSTNYQNIPAGTYYFTIAGQAQLVNHLI